MCCFLQGLKKSYDYKKVLKALKKGGCACAAGDSVYPLCYCMPVLTAAALAGPLLLPSLTQSSAATALSLMTLS